MENGLDIVSYKIGKEHGGVQPTGEIDITQNGITNVSGYATANVQVPEKQLEEKSITISTNTTTLIEPTQGKDGMSSVSVTTNIPQPSGKITITQNGTDIDVSSYASADVNVGGGVSEYFASEVEEGTIVNPSWYKMFKKIPAMGAKTNMNYVFKEYRLDILPDNVEASNIVSFQSTFSNVSSLLTKIDLSSWSLPNNITLQSNKLFIVESMFSGGGEQEIDISSLGKIHCNNSWIQNMFRQCGNLRKLNLSNFCLEPDTGVTPNYNANSMFYLDSSLQEIDMSSFDFTLLSNTNDMFYRVPTNCLILVKDQTQKDWFTTNFSTMTNVQIKSEYIANQGA